MRRVFAAVLLVVGLPLSMGGQELRLPNKADSVKFAVIGDSGQPGKGQDAIARQMANWRADSVQHFQEAADLADRHYRLGAVPISTYVELQEKYLEAIQGLLDTRREALEAGQTLELLTGLTPPLAQTAPTAQKPAREEKK